jgi:enamidase
MGKMLIRNIGTLVSGNVSDPILDADSILIADGKIKAVGTDLSAEGVDIIIDAQGTTVTPGLIDSHCHVVLGDFTPRQRMLDFLESELHGGVTQVISAGEVHLPGRPRLIAHRSLDSSALAKRCARLGR